MMVAVKKLTSVGRVSKMSPENDRSVLASESCHMFVEDWGFPEYPGPPNPQEILSPIFKVMSQDV